MRWHEMTWGDMTWGGFVDLIELGFVDLIEVKFRRRILQMAEMSLLSHEVHVPFVCKCFCTLVLKTDFTNLILSERFLQCNSKLNLSQAAPHFNRNAHEIPDDLLLSSRNHSTFFGWIGHSPHGTLVLSSQQNLIMSCHLMSRHVTSSWLEVE